MTRTFALALVAFSMASGPVIAQEAVDYFPRGTGSEWTYRTTNGGYEKVTIPVGSVFENFPGSYQTSKAGNGKLMSARIVGDAVTATMSSQAPRSAFLKFGAPVGTTYTFGVSGGWSGSIPPSQMHYEITLVGKGEVVYNPVLKTSFTEVTRFVIKPGWTTNTLELSFAPRVGLITYQRTGGTRRWLKSGIIDGVPLSSLLSGQFDRRAESSTRQAAVRDAKAQAKGTAAYVGGVLLKSAGEAALRGDAQHFVDAAGGLVTPEGLMSLGAFTGAMYGSQKGLQTQAVGKVFRKFDPRIGKVIRGTVPMALGMTAAQAVVTGDVDPGSVALSTGAYVGAGAAVNGGSMKVISLRMMKPVANLLQAAGPAGRVAGGALAVGQMAAMLTLGEQIEQGVKETILR